MVYQREWDYLMLHYARRMLGKPPTSGPKTITAGGSVASTTDNTNLSFSFTPAVNDLLVVCVAFSDCTSGNFNTITVTDNQSGTYTKIAATACAKSSGLDRMAWFVRDSLVSSAVSHTISTNNATTHSGGAAIGCRVAGCSATGASAIVQSAVQSNQTSGTPNPTFAVAPATGNAIVGAVFNITNPATMTPRSSPAYTELADIGYATPTNGLEAMFINSGDTATGITWGSAGGSAFCSSVMEISG